MKDHLLLIDASGFAHRAYHVGANQYRSDGLPTWGITGFMGLMWRLLGAAQADEPTHAAAVFDAPGLTFRHKLFPAYKRNRPARDLELAAQLPYLRHAAQAMGVAPVECVGAEADDVIATLATRARAVGMRTTIVSSDKDMLQLVVDGAVEVVDPVARVRLLEADVRGRKFGVDPIRVPEVQALAGDPVDNIPGIDGIGLKTAAALIRNFGTVEGVVEAAGARDPIILAGQRLRLRGQLEQLRLYRALATLKRDLPLDARLEDLVLLPIERAHIDKILATLEASGRFEAIFATEPKMQRVVEPLDPERALEWWEDEFAAPGQDMPDIPQCGFYMGRLVKNGPLLPGKIWREPEIDFATDKPTGKDLLFCEIAGRPADPVLQWSRLARSPISREKFDFEVADGAWCREHAPELPKGSPTNQINILAAPTPHCPPRRKRA